MEEYYQNLQSEVKENKSTDGQRTSKKKIQYIENAEHRRVTYARRSRSLIVAAQELEVQTRARMTVMIQPTWQNGKTHLYKSKAPGVAETESSVPSLPPVSVQTQEVSSVQDSPVRRREEGSQTAAGRLPCIRPVLVPVISKSACRICKEPQETSFWLGCGYLNPKTRKQDCSYWVHQNCIGLYYRQRNLLEKVPFFCRKHAPK